MDGRQIEHVESQFGHVGQARLDVLQRAVAPGLGRGGAREQLVPAAEARALAIDHQRQRLRPAGSQTAVRIAGGERGEFRVERQRLQRVGRAPCPEARRPLEQPPALLRRRARRGPFDQRRTDLRGDRDVCRIRAPLELVTPRQEMIHPGAHRVEVAPRGTGGEACAPDVVAERTHLGLQPVGRALGVPAQHHTQRIVPVGEAVGLDPHRLAFDAFDGEPPAIHRGPYRVDHRAHAAVAGRNAIRWFSHQRRSGSTRSPAAAA